MFQNAGILRYVIHWYLESYVNEWIDVVYDCSDLELEWGVSRYSRVPDSRLMSGRLYTLNSGRVVKLTKARLNPCSAMKRVARPDFR